jgi:hypothetical protein
MVPNYRVDIGERMQLDTAKTRPPFYQFGVVNMIVCQKWYALETSTLTWTEGEIAKYPTPCRAEDLPGLPQAQQMIRQQLETDGFDVTTLKTGVNE